LEIEVPTKTKETLYELKHESKLEEVDLDKADNENIESMYYLGLKRKSEEPVGWDWGDELKEEFGVEFLKEEVQNKDARDFEETLSSKKEEETIDDIFKTTEHIKPTFFDELETTVKKEIEETNEIEEVYETEGIHQVLEYTGEPRRYRFVDEQKFETSDTGMETNYAPATSIETTDEIMEEYKSNEKGFSFGKTFLIIFSSFIIVVAIILYMVMNNKEQPKEKITSDTGKDSFSLNQPETENKIDSSQMVIDEYSDFPRVAKLQPQNESSNINPVTDRSAAAGETTIQPTTKPDLKNNDLYRTLGTDTRVNKNIYFDGRQYNFQVSSWRNRYKAEQEVQRLRGKGYTAFAAEVYLPQKGGTWFRVRVGNFKSKEEAEQFFSNNTF
jgi:cell division septation protein DedD